VREWVWGWVVAGGGGGAGELPVELSTLGYHAYLL